MCLLLIRRELPAKSFNFHTGASRYRRLKAQQGHRRARDAARANGDDRGGMSTRKGLTMKLCKLKCRQKSVMRASKRLALAAVLASITSAASAQPPVQGLRGYRPPVHQNSQPVNRYAREGLAEAAVAAPGAAFASPPAAPRRPQPVPRREHIAPIVSAAQMRLHLRSDVRPAQYTDDGQGVRHAAHTSSPGGVQLAVAQAPSDQSAPQDPTGPSAFGESLIDIDVPIPGIPESSGHRPDSGNASSQSGGASSRPAEAVRKDSLDTGRPAGAQAQSPAPSVVPRGKTMRIQIEPVQIEPAPAL